MIKFLLFIILIVIVTAPNAVSSAIGVSPDEILLYSDGAPEQITIFNTGSEDMDFEIVENSGAVSFSRQSFPVPAQGKTAINASLKNSCKNESAEIKIIPKSERRIIPYLSINARLIGNCVKTANPFIGFAITIIIAMLGVIPYLRRITA
jgi:hypothetical protein